MTTTINSLEIEITKLRQTHINVESSEATENIEYLENRIIELKNSNEVYMRLNNALTARL